MMEGIPFPEVQRAVGCCETVRRKWATASGADPVKAFCASNGIRAPRNRLRACLSFRGDALCERNKGGTAKDFRPWGSFVSGLF